MNDIVEEAVRILIQLCGEDPTREGLRETPRRVVRAMSELTSGYKEDPVALLSKTFEADYDEMVVVRDIEFWSLCEHHMLPFHGTATVGYIPKGRVVGLSKIARVVKCFARRLQIQEKMTQEIAQSIQEALNPVGVGVVVKGQHTCMAMRGIKTPGTMITSCLLGLMRETAREEFLRFANGNG